VGAVVTLAAAEAVYCLNMVAQALLGDLLPADRIWMDGPGVVAHLWTLFTEACFLFNPSKSAHSALMLKGPLLQMTLAALCLHCSNPAHGLVEHERFARLLLAPMSTFSSSLQACAHPGLQRWLPSSSSLSPEQLGACGTNVQAALRHQVRRVTAANKSCQAGFA
jgi:hypothetical protein